MAGAYCRFCGQRCFVDRRMPADARWMPNKTVHLATCQRGAAYDRDETGYDFTTAINPHHRGEVERDAATTPPSGPVGAEAAQSTERGQTR